MRGKGNNDTYESANNNGVYINEGHVKLVFENSIENDINTIQNLNYNSNEMDIHNADKNPTNIFNSDNETQINNNNASDDFGIIIDENYHPGNNKKIVVNNNHNNNPDAKNLCKYYICI